MKNLRFFFGFSLLIVFFPSCEENPNNLSEPIQKTTALSVENKSDALFNDYWYSGIAEISSYELEQARYGEIRNGEAVLIFVTENFLLNSQVKMEKPTQEAFSSVLKLNFIRKFPTGIYDYSMMTSVFNPINQEEYALPLKVSTSSQDWCGHSWLQLNRTNSGFNLNSFSYFQAEGDDRINLKEDVLIEDAFWTQIRINPDLIPRGNRMVFPSTHFLRFSHQELKAYQAVITVDRNPDPSLKNFMVNYPELNRLLIITYKKDFPHEILSWQEEHLSGFGDAAKLMTTKAILKGKHSGPYWSQNKLENESLRDSLNLKN